jgi:hypothetical protein
MLSGGFASKADVGRPLADPRGALRYSERRPGNLTFWVGEPEETDVCLCSEDLHGVGDRLYRLRASVLALDLCL